MAFILALAVFLLVNASQPMSFFSQFILLGFTVSIMIAVPVMIATTIFGIQLYDHKISCVSKCECWISFFKRKK